MKLIKNIDNKYYLIPDENFDSNYHIDVSDSIYHWNRADVADYVLKRDNIKRIVSNNQWQDVKYKDIAIRYIATIPENIIAYYMSIGYTEQQAKQQYALDRIIDVQNAANCYCARSKNPQLQLYIIIFLGEEQGVTLNNAIANFKRQLCDIALLGTNYGDSTDGIMDFIESTGSYESGGLKSFTFTDEVVNQYGNQDAARQALIDIFREYIINGGYNL